MVKLIQFLIGTNKMKVLKSQHNKSVNWLNRGLYIILFLFSITVFSQKEAKIPAFQVGEKIKYRLSYSNFLNAGYATMDIRSTTNNGKEAFHVVGKGKTTGVISWFFKVKDRYETFFYKDSKLPYHFVRKIDEGGYTKDKEIFFNQNTHSAFVVDNKKDTENTYTTPENVQDILSALYYMRSKDISNFKKGDQISLKIFLDEAPFTMKLKFMGRETIKTKFGKVKSAIFRPLVQTGRVFKEKESVTIWVSDDDNKIPLRIRASLAVGSLRADIHTFKGLANSFPIVMD
jgi:hypothetical protein